jgi:hypothetical protein
MGIEIKPYTEDWISAVKDFNIRLKAGGVSFRFPESNIPQWLPKIDNRKIYQEYFLAVENNLTVRGGYILKHQAFSFKDGVISIADYQLPLSEGIVNKAYNLVGIQMLMNALKRQPLLFALGMGGYERPLPKMLKTMGWSMYSVPFFFKVNRPLHFLRNTTYLRRTRFRSLFIDILAITGLGWIAIKLLQTILEKKSLQNNYTSVEVVNDFSFWADELWNICKNDYSMIAVRDSITLNILYPSNSKRFIYLKNIHDDEVLGWAVVLDTLMSNHKQFGSMRVGSIVDCLALPENAFKVIGSATEFLEKRGIDVIVSNQSHTSWCEALKNAGFIQGPSNFIFAASKRLTELLHPFDLNKINIHMNRGDGDGPIHL